MADKKTSLIVTVSCCAALLLWAGVSLFAMCVTSGYEVEKKQIPYKISVHHSGFLQEGWKVWLKEGSNGHKNAVAENYRFADNIIKEKIIYETDMIKKPVEARVVIGHSKRANPIAVPKETYAHYTYDMVSTAYDPSPESNSVEWAGETALGWRTRYGIAAVDPKVIALRSLVFVDGYGFAWAGDTGGDIKGKRIDLCYNNTHEALKWGRRKVKVYVLGTKPWSQGNVKKPVSKNIK